MAVRDLVIRILGDDQSGAGFDSAGGKAKAFAKVAAVGAAGVAAAGLAAGKALYDIGGQFDDAYDKIRATTGATGGALSGLQDDFRKVVATVPANFGDASTAVASLNAKLHLAGPALQETAGQFLDLSRVTGTDLAGNIESGSDALQNFGVSVDFQTDALDQIFRASQKSGVSFADLSTQLAANGTVLKASGFSFEKSTALLAALGQAGVDSSEVMPALSKTLATAAKQGKDAGQVFDATFAAIKNAPTATGAAGKAMEVFGAKAGPKMAALIREGKLSYEDMLATVNDGGGDTIAKAGQDTADFSEKWQVFKNKALLALEPVASRVFSALGNYMDRFSIWWDKNGPAVIATVRRIGQQVQVWFGQAQVAIGQFITKAQPYFEQAKAIFEGFVTFGLALWNTFGNTIVTFLVSTTQNVLTILRGVFTVIQGILDLFIGVFTGDWGRAWDGVKEIFAGTWTVITGLFSQFVDTIVSSLTVFGIVVSGIWDGIWSTASTMLDKTVGLISDLPGKITGLGGLMLAAGANLIGKMFEGITSAAGAGADFAKGIANTLIRFINDHVLNPLNHFQVEIPLGFGRSYHQDFPDIGPIPQFASGVTNFSGGLAVVGEEGAELVRLPRGSDVIPNRQSRALAAAGTSVTIGQVNIIGSHVTANDVGREIAWRLRVGVG